MKSKIQSFGRFLSGMSEILERKNIILNSDLKTKKDVIKAMGKMLTDSGYTTEKYIQAMLDKEKVFNTAIGNFVAIPHGIESGKVEVLKTGLAVMSAASLATSVPEIPIATPMSAFLRAGESLTPSPVTATICPSSCRAETTWNFCSGATRAKMTSSFRASFNSSSESFSSSSPEMILGCSPWMMPILLAMLSAVRP